MVCPKLRSDSLCIIAARDRTFNQHIAAPNLQTIQDAPGSSNARLVSLSSTADGVPLMVLPTKLAHGTVPRVARVARGGFGNSVRSFP